MTPAGPSQWTIGSLKELIDVHAYYAQRLREADERAIGLAADSYTRPIRELQEDVKELQRQRQESVGKERGIGLSVGAVLGIVAAAGTIGGLVMMLLKGH